MVSKYSYSWKLVSANAERIEIVKPDSPSGDILVLVLFPLFFPVGAGFVYQGFRALITGQWGASLALIAFGSLICFAMSAFVVSIFKPRSSGFIITPKSIEETFRRPIGGRTSTLLPIRSLSEVHLEAKWLDFVAVWVPSGGEQLDLFEGDPRDCERVADIIAQMYGAMVSLATQDFSRNGDGMIHLDRIADSGSFPSAKLAAAGIEVLSEIQSGDKEAATRALRQNIRGLLAPNLSRPNPPLRAFFPKGADYFQVRRKTGLAEVPTAAIQGFRMANVPNVGGIARNGMYYSMQALVAEMVVDGEGCLMVGFVWDESNRSSDGLQVGAPPMIPSVQFIMRYYAAWTGRPYHDGGRTISPKS